jgi:hypothetical protein
MWRASWRPAGLPHAGQPSDLLTFDRAPRITLATLVGVTTKLNWSERLQSEVGWPR